MLIKKQIINRILLFFIPNLFVLSLIVFLIYDRQQPKLDYSEIVLIGLSLLLTIFSYFELKDLARKIKIKNTLLTQKVFLYPKMDITESKTKLRFGNKRISTNNKYLDVIENSDWIMHINKNEKSISSKKSFSTTNLKFNDIDYWILEYDNFIKFTLLGLFSRGQQNTNNSLSNISVKLNSGKIVRMCKFNFSNTIFMEYMQNSGPKEEIIKDFDSFSIGKKAIEIIAQTTNKKYLVINYEDSEASH